MKELLDSKNRKFLKTPQIPMIAYWNSSGIAILLILQGCHYHADHPWDYTPCSYQQTWQPCGDEGIPISPCRLIDPFQCIEPESLPGVVGLPDIIDLALKNSNMTRQTWADARYAAAQWGIQEAPLYPQWGFEAFVKDIRQSNFHGTSMLRINDYINYGPLLTLQYLLFDWGTTKNEAESFRQILWEANWTHNREIQTVIQTAAVDYYAFLAFREQVVASRANLTDALTLLDSTEKKHNLGITDISDVLMAETQVAKNEIQLLDDQQNEADGRIQLEADMGIPANTPLTILGEMEIPELEEVERSVDPYLVQAYSFRPDLFSANARVKSKEFAVRAAIRDQWPKIQFNGNAGQNYYNAGEHDDYNFDLEISLQAPLFEGYYYKNQIRASRAQLERARAELREMEIGMIQQVTKSHQNFLLAIDKVRVNRAYVHVAEASYRSSLAKYRAGTVDITTAITALTDLADARFSLVAAKREWFTSLVDLAYATGAMGC